MAAAEELVSQIESYAAAKQPVQIVGGGSKHFLGRDLSALPSLNTSGLNQILSYEPSELVLRVEAGCPLVEINAVLKQERQMLAFEPPEFGGSTIGGAIASGISGSRRPFAGAGRDFLLGVGLIDGTGQQLSFGGQVMKNVAGYDVSRLMAGALGCLGLITEVSLKVLPMPELEESRSLALDRADFLREANRQSALPEVTALAWWQGRMYVRFSGSAQTVVKRVSALGGEPVEPDFWEQLDSHQLFADADSVWRVSCKPMASGNGLQQADLIDWGGAQRWVLGQDQPALDSDAYATWIRRDKSDVSGFAPLTKPVFELHKRLKATFDPHHILNPNKLYEGV